MESAVSQINIARTRGPVDGPIMAEFAANLDVINKVLKKAKALYGDQKKKPTIPSPSAYLMMIF